MLKRSGPSRPECGAGNLAGAGAGGQARACGVRGASASSSASVPPSPTATAKLARPTGTPPRDILPGVPTEEAGRIPEARRRGPWPRRSRNARSSSGICRRSWSAGAGDGGPRARHLAGGAGRRGDRGGGGLQLFDSLVKRGPEGGERGRKQMASGDARRSPRGAEELVASGGRERLRAADGRAAALRRPDARRGARPGRRVDGLTQKVDTLVTRLDGERPPSRSTPVYYVMAARRARGGWCGRRAREPPLSVARHQGGGGGAGAGARGRSTTRAG